MWCNLLWLVLAQISLPSSTSAQSPPATGTKTNPPPIILTVEGTNVFVQRFTSNAWEKAYPSQVLAAKDRGRTGSRSRASVRLSDLSIMRIAERSEFEIQPLPDKEVEAEFSLFRGLMYLLNRDRPGKHRFITPTATAATRGTEFTLEVEEATGRTTLTVLEGEAELSNASGSIRIKPGEQGIASLGQPPTKTAVVETFRAVQWCLYYPGVLDLDELPLTPAERAHLQSSLDFYRSGDLLRAVSAFPTEPPPASDAEKVYAAALLLAVGQADQSGDLLNSLARGARTNAIPHRLAEALRVVIHTVTRNETNALIPSASSGLTPQIATELLAKSYADQANLRLEDALLSARLATRKSPEFAFAWARVAELEFSQGHIRLAMNALDRSLSLAPHNAQAIALKGFLLSARNEIHAAISYFDRAIELDGGLGNGWLGRGLCKIRLGDAEAGRFDLHVAATTEPRRALLRSYLGKAFSNEGDHRHAEKELLLAKEIDAGDPTPWLYSALLLQQQNRINEGIRDLEHSRELNDNRALYRSRLLLDQDRAVSGANLANLYRDAGMTELSAREAGRAVNLDYANHSAHRFLADSFNALRDPSGFSQRYESAWFTEYLLANLLAPVGAGGLSQTVSDQDYSKLFENDHLGFASTTVVASHGAWVQKTVQYGVWKNASYAVEGSYLSDNGWRANNDLERTTGLVEFKYDATPDDAVYFFANYSTTEAGDRTGYYRQAEAIRRYRSQERMEPALFAGFRHQWNPNHITLLLAGCIQQSFDFWNPSQVSLFFDRGLGGPIREVAHHITTNNYAREVENYSAELQHIWKKEAHTFVAGGRLQSGTIRVSSRQNNSRINLDGLSIGSSFASTSHFESGYDRYTAYLYDHWTIWPTLTLVGGVTYDWLQRPSNYRIAPLVDKESTTDKTSPKTGFVWSPSTDTTIRGAYFQALSGVDLDQSIRIEPSQVAGFNQSFRSLVPESISGANDGARFNGWSASFEQKYGGTFLGVSAELLSSQIDRQDGAVNFAAFNAPPIYGSQTRENIDYRERNLFVTLDQMVGDDWTFGLRYRLTKSEIERTFPEIPAAAILHNGIERTSDFESVLHQLQLSALYNHPSGFFGRGWGIWSVQSNQGYTPDRPGDNFWQFNVEAGWRFFRRRMEARVALLNLTDQNYRLNPLNLTAELPREREVVASLRFNF